MYLGMKSTFLNSVAMAGLWYRLKSLLQFERRTSLGIGNFAIRPHLDLEISFLPSSPRKK